MRRAMLVFPTLLLGLACSGAAPDGADAAGASDVATAGAGAGQGTGMLSQLNLSAQSSGTEALLQAVSPVSAAVVWVSGHGATFARTLDGGEKWTASTVAGADGLQFREVAAFDTTTAYLMSAGTGELSRIYRTDDGGTTWALQHTAEDAEAFFDCMDFWTPERGLVYGDEVDGFPFILSTTDGGAHWTRVPAAGLPAALDGEGGFAASGTCLVTGENGAAWIATGNGERARVLSTHDFGASWTAVDAPVVGGSSAGLATVQMGAAGLGIALGGRIGQDSVRTENVMITSDGGVTWQPGGPLAMEGPVYGSALVPDRIGRLVVAAGPRGLVWSEDLGQTWAVGDTLSYWAVVFVGREAGWAVGPRGRITKLSVSDG
ncbi:MAG: hypothetical protein O2992_14520 [Gemmatimonadetes bacterium]|nr:hypothetical protein [Gemmatimonadota bacterium]